MILYIQTLISLIRSVHVISMKKCVFLHIMHSSSALVSSSLSSSGRFTFFTGASFCFAAKTSSILSCFSWFFRLDFLVFLIGLCSNNTWCSLSWFALLNKSLQHLLSSLDLMMKLHLFTSDNTMCLSSKSLQSPYRVKPIKSSRIN